MNQIIDKLRQTQEDIKNIILKNITVTKSTRQAVFTFVNNNAVSEQLALKIEKFLREYVPASITVIRAEFIKQVCDIEILKDRVFSYIKENFIAVSSFIKADNISGRITDKGFIYEIKSGEGGFKYFEENNLISNLNSYLNRTFCENFSGNLILTDEKINAQEILSKAAKMELFNIDEPLKRRVFKIENISDIDGELTDNYAIYMSDCDFETDKLTVCGEIKQIQQKMTKTDKPYYLFELSDGTYEDGQRTFKAKMFPRKKTLEKLALLKTGDFVVLSGKMESFNNNLSMFIEKINYGKLPENFIPEKRKSKEPFPDYITIKPEPYIEYSQSNLFEKKELLPDDLVNNTFVVFDLETTGLVNSALGNDRMDTITEIGAVKIIGGVISEKFTSLVNPCREISKEITDITGIDNEMVKDAPMLNKIIPDFFKFTRGAYLVGHNVEFDYKFIRHYSKESGYIYDNKAFDTLSLSQQLLFLSNNKLNTVAEHFGFVFTHHRAFDDALTTAKIFIELIKAKKHLPN
jgi:DNA polymerase III epsilon subunit family exonuclease